VDGQPCWLDAEEMRAMLTPHGARVLRSAAPTHVRGVRDNLVDLLSPEERPVLTEGLRAVHRHLRKPAVSNQPDPDC
jgi:hypothetical protein